MTVAMSTHTRYTWLYMGNVVRRQRNPDRKPGRIKRDGSRTMPRTVYFSEAEAEGLKKLAQVLRVSESELLHDGMLFYAQRALVEGIKPPAGRS